jgi:hypothetical protein
VSRKFLTNVDLTGNQLLTALLENVAGNPSSPADSRIWYDSSGHAVKVQINGATIDLKDLGSATGSTDHTHISDFTAAVQALRWASMTAPNAAVAMAGQQFSSLGTASGSGQAVEYTQFNAALANIQTGMDIKEQQGQVVATVNINTASPGATISGHAMVAGDRVLLAAQSTNTQDGIYVWNGATSALTRSADANTTGSIMPGTMVVIGGEDGSNPNTIWMQTATGTGSQGAIVLGTDAQTWIRVLSPVTLTAGNGISLTAGVIAAVAAAAGGLSVGAGGIALDKTIAATKFTGTFTGNGTTTTFAVTHNLNNLAPLWVVYNGTQEYDLEFQPSTANAGSFVAATAPPTGTYNYTLIG